MDANLLAVTVVEVFGYIAIVVCAIIALVVTWVAWQIWKFKRAVNQLGTSFKELGKAMEQGTFSRSLGLERTEENLFNNEAEATAQMHLLQTAGMRFGGFYTTKHMPGVKIATFADPSRCVSASVGVAPSHGLMMDVITMYDDGSAVTHRTLRSQGLDHPPEFRNVFVPNAPADLLLKRHLAERDNKPARAIEPADVADAMEEFNQAVIEWRTSRGGLTEEEVRRNLQVTGSEVDEFSVKMLVAMSQAEATTRQREQMKEQLLPLIGWDETRWGVDGTRVIFVQDGMPEDHVINLLYTADSSPDEDDLPELREAIGEVGARKAFRKFVDENPDLGIEFLASSDGAMQFDAYLHPAEEEEDDD